jgi:carbon-monoxide dehydrogenase large subunit
MVHAAFLRSEVAKATITRLDTTAASELPGVVAIFTASDFEGRFGPAWHAMLGEELQVPAPLAAGDVRHVGEPVAIVLATSRYVAEDACELIELDLDPQTPVVDFASGRGHRAPRCRLGVPSNAWSACRSHHSRRPRRGVRLRGARRRVHVRQNRYLCVPMEGRGIIADWAGRDEIDIVCSCQSVHEPQLLRPLPRHPRRRHPGHRT